MRTQIFTDTDTNTSKRLFIQSFVFYFMFFFTHGSCSSCMRQCCKQIEYEQRERKREWARERENRLLTLNLKSSSYHFASEPFKQHVDLLSILYSTFNRFGVCFYTHLFVFCSLALSHHHQHRLRSSDKNSCAMLHFICWLIILKDSSSPWVEEFSLKLDDFIDTKWKNTSYRVWVIYRFSFGNTRYSFIISHIIHKFLRQNAAFHHFPQKWNIIWSLINTRFLVSRSVNEFKSFPSSVVHYSIGML